MRVKSLPFLPRSMNYSQLTEASRNLVLGQAEEEYPDLDKELILLNTLSTLKSDKERCVLLLEILREYGYQLDYNSIAQSLNIQLRWFMRVKKSMKKKVLTITVNE